LTSALAASQTHTVQIDSERWHFDRSANDGGRSSEERCALPPFRHSPFRLPFSARRTIAHPLESRFIEMTAPTAPPSAARKRPNRGSPVSWTAVTLISLAITGYFVGQYAAGSLDVLSERGVGLATTYANRPFPVQTAFYVHIVSAGLALAVGPFQFAKAIRVRYRAVHRWIGRTYAVSIAFASVSGLVMAAFNSAGFVGFFGFGTLSVLWAWTTWRGYRAIRERDVASHQAWMIRSFALTFAAPTLRLWLGVLILFQVVVGTGGADVEVDQLMANAYAAVPFLCWLPNIVVAEIMIRRRDLPGLRFSPSPSSRGTARADAVAVQV
jgi:uncharacterized membrane protein